MDSHIWRHTTIVAIVFLVTLCGVWYGHIAYAGSRKSEQHGKK